jgi:heme A synthase
MKKVYRVLAYAVAALVAIQAALIGYGVFAQLKFVEDGGTIDESVYESDAPGTAALLFHGLNGGVLLLVALALLIVSFFAKIPRGVRWAVIILVCTVVQIALGVLSHLLAAVGALHGVVAMVLFGAALMAAMRVRRAAAVEEAVPANVA